MIGSDLITKNQIMNAINFYIFAKTAASEYLTQGKVLSESIAKLADKNNLSQMQIQRVLEMANHEVNETLRKTASDKSFTFAVAKLEDVLAHLQTPSSSGVAHEKVAQTIEAFNRGYGEADLEKTAADMADAYGHKDLINGLELKALSKTAGAKIDAAIGRAESERVGALDKLAVELRQLVSDMKQFIAYDGGDLASLHKCALAIEPGSVDSWNMLFGALETELKKLGHPFTGPLASKSRLAVDYDGRHTPVKGPSVTVINGAAPIIKRVKQVHETISKTVRASDRKRDLDNFKDLVTLKTRSLKDNAEVRAYIGSLKKMAHASIPEITKLAEESAGLTKKDRAKVVGSVAAGEGLNFVSRAALKSAGENLLHNYVPAAHANKTMNNLPQYLRGKV